MAGFAGDTFFQLGLIVILSAAAIFLLRLLRQPQILAYVLVGIIITPLLHLVTDTGIIESMSIVGIAFLLFLVGLEMDLSALKSVALISTLGALMQVAFLFLIGYFISVVVGFLPITAIYLGLIVAFSSTMVVLKTLSDRRELQTLHGRIVIGILLMQDVVAIFALSLIDSVGSFNFLLLGLGIAKFLLLFAVAFLSSKYFFPFLFRYAARHQEMLLVLSLAVCFAFSLVFQRLGFSLAVGAFIAGICLGNLQYRVEMIAKMRSLRDFFALLFFVSLGMALSLTAVRQHWVLLIILLVLTLIVKPVVVLLLCSLFKYAKKPSFFTANALGQIGEFSLIFAAQGLQQGHLSQELFSLVVLDALLSITITSYVIKYQYRLYALFSGPLRIFTRFTAEGMEYLPTEVQPQIILCGHNRIGYSILKHLQKFRQKVLVVDYDPEVITSLVKEGYHCLYGDVTDEEILERMHLPRISLLISTVPGVQDNLRLIKKVRSVNKKANVVVTAADIESALLFYAQGATYVIMPHFLGGEQVGKMIGQLHFKSGELFQEGKKHIEHIQERQALGQEHPFHL